MEINSSGSSRPRNFVVVNNKLFFIADDGTRGEELWISDGTAAGTRLVKDINPGASDSRIHFPTKVGNKLFFVADDGKTGPELWVSDGTRPGTKLVRDLQPGLASILTSPKTLTAVGNKLYFTFEAASTGQELWCSDGTNAGTKLVADIHKGDFDARISSMKLAGGFLFFDADDGRTGRELWALDVSADLAAAQRSLPIARAASQNDNLPLITLTVSPSVLEDGTNNLEYVFTRTGPVTKALTVKASVGGTASLGKDYSGIAATSSRSGFTFAAGSSTTSVTVKPMADSIIEPDETVVLTLVSGTEYRIGTPGAVIGTIRNDDTPSYLLSTSHSSINEGKTLTTTVRTTGVPTNTRLYWALTGDGLNAADFTKGALTGSGQVGRNGSFSFSHTLRNDATTESEESLQLRLYRDPARTSAVGSPVSVTILDSSKTPVDPLKPIAITGSTTIPTSLSRPAEVDRYAVDVVSGAILTASVSSTNTSLYPLIHLKNLDGSMLKNPIAFNGNSADLGMVDLVTGKALIDVKAQIGATGNYVLNVSISTRDAIRSDVIRLTNLERAKAGLAPLTRNSLLEQAAEGHVQDMDASNTYLAHTGSKGSSPTDRIKATGYKAAWVDLGNGSMRTISSENAASGYTSAAQVVQAWMNSSGHRAAIMDPATKEIGVGFDYDNETGTTYWLQNFGHPWAAGMTQWF